MPPKEKPEADKTEKRELRRESKAAKELSAAKDAAIKEIASPGATASGITAGGLEKHFVTFKEEVKGMFKTLDNSIDAKISKLETKFSGLFDELKEEVRNMKSNIEKNENDIIAINEKLEDYETSIEFNSSMIKDTEQKQIKKLEEAEKRVDDKIKELENKLLLLEKQDRKYNLLFYGIPEEANERLYDKMRHFFETELGIEKEAAQNIHFVNGHRYPTKNKGPNPVIIRFSTWNDRELVLSHAKNLLNTGKRILTDLPTKMKIERNRIANIAYQIRKGEELQTRIKDKGLDLYLEVRKNKAAKWVRRDIPKEDGEDSEGEDIA